MLSVPYIKSFIPHGVPLPHIHYQNIHLPYNPEKLGFYMEHFEVNIICKSYTACYWDEINNGVFNIGLMKKIHGYCLVKILPIKNNNCFQRNTFSILSTCIGKMFTLI